MKYSPKLKTAMERIKAILKEYDIAGTIVLHTPGFSEYLLKIDPSYSVAKIEGEGLKIKANLADYSGDKIARDKALNDTVNLTSHFADINGMVAINMIDVLDELKKHMDIESFDGGHSSHISQNN